MPDTLTIALRVRGAVLSSDPAFALLEVTQALGRQLLAHLDQIAQLHAEDERVRSLERTGDDLTWLADVDPPLDQHELRRRTEAVLEGERLAGILHAVDRDPELQASIEDPVLVCHQDGTLWWRCYPRYSDDDVVFTTAYLSRDTLMGLLARLR